MTKRSELYQELDHLVERLGKRQVTLLLRQLNTEPALSLPVKVSERVLAFFRDACEVLYQIDGDKLETANHQAYYEARNACFLLLSRYLGFSYRTIGDQFGLNKRQVAYGVHKLSTIERSNQEHPSMQRFQLLREQLIQFLNQQASFLNL